MISQLVQFLEKHYGGRVHTRIPGARWREPQTSTVLIYWAIWEQMRWSECKLYGENRLARNSQQVRCKRLDRAGGVCRG
jgi:hypothetical protein